jgi:hypothetical protein
MAPFVRTLLALAFAGVVAAPAGAQTSKSAALAKQLSAALDAAKLDSIAAKDPSAPDAFVGALYFPGVQLLVVSAKYAVPPLMTEQIAKKNYRNVYLDLFSASIAGSKTSVSDLGADGLVAEPDDNQPFDTYDAGKAVAFDGDWDAQKMSEEEYMKTFAAADEKYSQMLSALLAEVKKT